MKRLEPVIWAKGTFLTPQHLQIQDRFLENTLQFQLEALSFRPWGCRQLLANQELLAGGTFAISNLGMFGIREFTAIINPPHSAILAVGTAEERVIVRNGQMVVAQVMTLTMSCDHRVIDGALGAEYLKALRQLLENPTLLLI